VAGIVDSSLPENEEDWRDIHEPLELLDHQQSIVDPLLGGRVLSRVLSIVRPATSR
jgi:hypothetical protein